MPDPYTNNPLEDRKQQKERTRKYVKNIIIISVLVVVLVSIIAFAASQREYIIKFIQGKTDPVSSTLRTITNTNPTPIPTSEGDIDFNKLLDSFVTPSPSVTPQNIGTNRLILYPGKSTYRLTFKKGQEVEFVNQRQQPIALKFSDGKEIALREGEDEVSTFLFAGTYTFVDELDITSAQINGTFVVE